MNQRLQQFITAENISQSQFADKIGVARASISHILAGRNRPGFDFIESMAKNFPALNIEWLITGKGKMYKSDKADIVPERVETDLFSSMDQEENKMIFTAEPQVQKPIEPEQRKTESVLTGSTPYCADKGISKVIIFFNDGTYRELK